MAIGWTRGLTSLLATPFSGLLWLVHRRAVPAGSWIELESVAEGDLAAMSGWMLRLRRLGTDPQIAGVLLQLRQTPGSWASCEDLREVIAALRARGKRVVVQVHSPSNAACWIAAAADEAWITPMDEVQLVGLGAELTFFGDALNKLGVSADFVAAGAYKSFGEPFQRTFASAESREALEAILAELQQTLVTGIAEGRGLTEAAVRGLMARAPLLASEAVDAGLFTGMAYEWQLRERIEEREDVPRLVGARGWAMRDALFEQIDGLRQPDAVAVLHLDGPIVLDDDTGTSMIRAQQVVPVIHALKADDEVRSVVLHIRSPGGSAYASELLWKAVEELAEAKPVVASFSDVSASGGFYLAAPATEIVARATTVTGSIGVFGGKVVLGPALRRLGVLSQGFAQSPHALMASSSKAFTASERDRVRRSMQYIYDGFVERVAKGRARSTDEIEPFCRGRVWTGHAAQARGLVDHLGSLDLALERARRLARVRSSTTRRVDLVVRPPPAIAAILRDWLRRRWSVEQRELLSSVIGERVLPWMRVLLRSPGEAMAMLPFDLRIR